MPFELPPLPPMTPARDSGLVDFAKITLKRAFRVRIDPAEVTAQERATLTAAGITEPTAQAFLAWRRSVLAAFATLLAVLIILEAIEIFQNTPVMERLGDARSTLRGLGVVRLLVEVAFCALCWHQLRAWTQWRAQRRLLTIGWLAFFAAPFVLWLYPLRTAVPDEMQRGGGVLFSMQMALAIAPRAAALVPGVLRASMVTKLLFPGTSAPGWIVVVTAPLYAVLVYVLLVVPYQLTGSGFFVLGLAGAVAAYYVLTRAGYELTRPMNREEVSRALSRVRTSYLIALGVGALFTVFGIAELVDQLDLRPLTIVNLIGGLLLGVWILTLVATDHVIASLERARGVSAGTTALSEESTRHLAAFVSGRAPEPGPAATPRA